MSTIQDINKIDGIGIDKIDSNIVTLQIIDPLTWEEEENHLYLLQEKLNNYLTFIETKEIYQVYPKAKDKNIVFSINFLEKPTANCFKFLDITIKLLQDSGYDLEYSIDNTIDKIQIEKDTRNITLIIENEVLHTTEEEYLYWLQEKINEYLSFISSKEFSEVYPNATTHKIAIKINSINEFFEKNTIAFLNTASTIIQKDGYILLYKK